MVLGAHRRTFFLTKLTLLKHGSLKNAFFPEDLGLRNPFRSPQANSQPGRIPIVDCCWGGVPCDHVLLPVLVSFTQVPREDGVCIGNAPYSEQLGGVVLSCLPVGPSEDSLCYDYVEMMRPSAFVLHVSSAPCVKNLIENAKKAGSRIRVPSPHFHRLQDNVSTP